MAEPAEPAGRAGIDLVGAPTASDSAPLRVLSVIESLGRGGAERLLVTLDRAFDRARIHHTVVHLFAPDLLREELERRGTRVIDLALPGPEALPRAVRALAAVLKRERPHVVHTHLFSANVAGRLASFGRVPVVTTLHNPDYGSDAGAGWRFWVRAFLDRASGHLVPSRILAVSEHVRDDFQSHMGFGDIALLPNVVDVAELSARASALDRTSVRRDLGIAPDAWVVLNVGRLHPQKGQDVLIRGFAEAHGILPQSRLVIVGAGGEENALRRLADDLGVHPAVRFAGSVPDVMPWLVAADVFAFPSRFEAFGIALLEAMAVGLPSIVSDIPGLLEVTTRDASVVLPSEDPGAWAKALVDLYESRVRARRLGEEARVRARSFDVGPAARALERLYATEASRARAVL